MWSRGEGVERRPVKVPFSPGGADLVVDGDSLAESSPPLRLSCEWFEGACPKCGVRTQLREFWASGTLCADCYFARGRQMKTLACESTNEEPRGANVVARATYGSARHLGSATRSMHDSFSVVRSFLRECPKALVRLPATLLKRSVRRGPPSLDPDVIRSIVAKELARVLDADAVARLPAFEGRTADSDKDHHSPSGETQRVERTRSGHRSGHVA